MPLEALTCTNCGSPDVIEVKANTYFCNSCDTVFKYVQPSRGVVSNELCSCGIFATGRCSECGAPVCQTHGSLLSDALFCPTHLRERLDERDERLANEAAERRLRDAEEAAELAARQVELISGWEREVLASLATDHWAARICRVVRAAQEPVFARRPNTTVPTIAERSFVIQRLLPEYFAGADSYSEVDPPWNEIEIARWFADASREPPSGIYAGGRRTAFGGLKSFFVSGWFFEEGSTRPHLPDGMRYLAAAISAKGTRLYYSSESFSKLVTEMPDEPGQVVDDHFRMKALASMAKRVALPPLPEPPEDVDYSVILRREDYTRQGAER